MSIKDFNFQKFNYNKLMKNYWKICLRKNEGMTKLLMRTYPVRLRKKDIEMIID